MVSPQNWKGIALLFSELCCYWEVWCLFWFLILFMWSPLPQSPRSFKLILRFLFRDFGISLSLFSWLVFSGSFWSEIACMHCSVFFRVYSLSGNPIRQMLDILEWTFKPLIPPTPIVHLFYLLILLSGIFPCLYLLTHLLFCLFQDLIFNFHKCFLLIIFFKTIILFLSHEHKFLLSDDINYRFQ